ncbi:MAG: hypothetical protein DMD89_19500 [Candidatus Rokuibacteriota bacterium]|nr:MAG: hypothetical protein DMD89_19500 [Candidatus Rokubacteria bacterium]
MNRCHACVAAGIICLHLVGHDSHGHHQPATTGDQEHTHQDYERVARIIDVNVGVTTSSGALPPGSSNVLDEANRIARRPRSRLSPSLTLTTPLSFDAGDVRRSLLVRITRATTINDFAWL